MVLNKNWLLKPNKPLNEAINSVEYEIEQSKNKTGEN